MIELIGQNKQFVAWGGHANKNGEYDGDYVWDDGKDPENTPLPEVGEEQVKEFLDKTFAMLKAEGCTFDPSGGNGLAHAVGAGGRSERHIGHRARRKSTSSSKSSQKAPSGTTTISGSG